MKSPTVDDAMKSRKEREKEAADRVAAAEAERAAVEKAEADAVKAEEEREENIEKEIAGGSLAAFADWFYDNVGKMHPPEIPAQIAQKLERAGFISPFIRRKAEEQEQKLRDAPFLHGDPAALQQGENAPPVGSLPLAGSPFPPTRGYTRDYDKRLPRDPGQAERDAEKAASKRDHDKG